MQWEPVLHLLQQGERDFWEILRNPWGLGKSQATPTPNFICTERKSVGIK